jgi:hypothetical protein
MVRHAACKWYNNAREIADVRVYESFVKWVEEEVQPLQTAHPNWTRLDGWENGPSNVQIVAKFRYEGYVWGVHGDTRFAPVFGAYTGYRASEDDDPFIIRPTKTGLGLNVKPKYRVHPRFSYFYVYTKRT